MLSLPICFLPSLYSEFNNGGPCSAVFQTIGGAGLVGAAQAGFVNQILNKLPSTAPGVNPAVVVTAGATELRTLFSGDELRGVIVAYMAGIKSYLRNYDRGHRHRPATEPVQQVEQNFRSGLSHQRPCSSYIYIRRVVLAIPNLPTLTVYVLTTHLTQRPSEPRLYGHQMVLNLHWHHLDPQLCGPT